MGISNSGSRSMPRRVPADRPKNTTATKIEMEKT